MIRFRNISKYKIFLMVVSPPMIIYMGLDKYEVSKSSEFGGHDPRFRCKVTNFLSVGLQTKN